MKTDRFYMGNGAVNVTSVAAAVCFAVAAVLKGIEGGHFLFDIFLCVSVLVMYGSVVKHEKNIMKSMMGTVLILYVVLTFTVPDSLLSDGSYASEVFSGADIVSVTLAAFGIVSAVLSVVLFILHLVICTGVNRALSALKFMITLIIVLIGLTILKIAVTAAGGVFSASEAFEDIAVLFMLAVILIIELKLCAYKILRRSAAEESRWNAMEKRKLKKKVFGE